VTRIDRLLADAREPLFSFEFFPPKSPAGEENLQGALEDLRSMEPAFVSVTYGAGGSTRDKTVEIVGQLRDSYGLEAMAHLTCVNATSADLRRTLEQMHEAGIENVLALRGDPPRGEERWTKTVGGYEYAAELIATIRDEYPFAVGAAAFPETHIHATRLKTIYVTSRRRSTPVRSSSSHRCSSTIGITSRSSSVRAMRDRCTDHPGVMPILTLDGIRRMTELSAAELPPACSMSSRSDAATTRQWLSSASRTRPCNAPTSCAAAPLGSTSSPSTGRRNARDPQRSTTGCAVARPRVGQETLTEH
jgi:methylenetetrahydrofolate reductase (NADPH)